MPVQEHKHTENCPYDGYGYLHYLVAAAPAVLWYDVQDVGSYQGSVYGIGEYKNQILIYEDGYGSCSGCGAWGEGGEPKMSDAIKEIGVTIRARHKHSMCWKRLDEYQGGAGCCACVPHPDAPYDFLPRKMGESRGVIDEETYYE